MSHPLFDISGRTALVTGSSRGIGLALARGLAEAGCTVVLNGRDPDRLAEAAAELPGDVRTAVFDVTDGPAVAAGIADVEERVGPLDILVNNAGMQLRAPLLWFTDAVWHRILVTIVSSAFVVGREGARRR
ncbi:SDR family NAD(P)-dependent oxidoreductase, partial [Streptomyces tricolor]